MIYALTKFDSFLLSFIFTNTVPFYYIDINDNEIMFEISILNLFLSSTINV